MDAFMHRKYGGIKSNLLKDHPHKILEIGAGYGANFRYLSPGTQVIAIEPDRSMHDLLARRAKKYSIDLIILASGAEEIQLEDGSIPMVLGSLVLCTVEDPIKSLSEILRVLKKEGTFVYVEHVRAHRPGILCSIQRLMKKPWKWVFNGCHVDRETGSHIREAGFSRIEQQSMALNTLFMPIIPHIYGVAKK